MIVKHANPCGAAVAETIEEAYAKALAADPVSAYGGVVVVNRAVTAALAAALAAQFVEVLFAPAYDAAALDRLAGSRRCASSSTRISARPTRRSATTGGSSAASSSRIGIARPSVATRCEVVCGEVSDAQWDDLLFAWRVVKHVTSNAIVLARRGQTLGIGAGQMSRVDAVRIAIEKARELGHSLEGAVLASDAFFPFADGPQLALEAGIAAFIQPGGSKRDDEVIEAVSAKPARRWSSPAAATSGTDGRRRSRRSPARLLLGRRERTSSDDERDGGCARASEDEIADAYRRLHDAHALVLFPDTDGDLDGEPVLLRADAAPRPRRRPDLDGTCCWDALGIPGALHSDGEVATECACCGDAARARRT